MGYYTDLWKKQKQSGVYQTRDGGKVYKNEAVRQADKAVQAAVQSAQQQQSSGRYKTTSGGVVTSTPRATTTYTPKTTAVNIPNLMQSFTPTPAPAKTRTNPRQIASAVPNGAAIATSDRAKAAANQYYKYPQMFQGGRLQDMEATFSDEVTKPTGTIATASQRFQLAPELNRYNEATVLDLLNRYGVTQEQVGMPLEYLYYGGSSYMGAPHLLKHSNDYVLQDHNGNRITVGDLRYALENGLYMMGNEQAYNDWVKGVAQNEVRTVDPYEYEDFGGWEDDGYSLPDYAQDIIDAQNAQYQALISALQGQSGTLDQQYAESARDLYANYMRQGLALPEQLAGTSTGTADSMLLQNDLNYQNNLYQNELARQAAQQDLQNQINQYGAEAALQSAQTAAEWAQIQWQQEQAEREAEREYQLNLAKLNQQNKGGGSSSNDTAKTTTMDDVKKYLQRQLGMGNNMTKGNIEKMLKDMYAAGAISKEMAKGVASDEFGFTLYL